MIRSMTGYARAELTNGFYRVTVELRSVNGKHLDLFIRMPRDRLDLEEVVRDVIRKRLQRGRVECYVSIETVAPTSQSARIHLQTARAYWDALYQLHLKLPGADPPKLEHILRLPGIWEADSSPPEVERLRELVAQASEHAVDRLVDVRAGEGLTMARDLLERLQEVHQEWAQVEARRLIVSEELHGRLKTKIQEVLEALGGTVDENRLLQELAYLLDRTDINEELVRLKSHLDQMVQWINGEEAVEGRRLDFMAQELLREVNTIGSKANDLMITQSVVRMKNAIGRLKEQIQNIE